MSMTNIYAERRAAVAFKPKTLHVFTSNDAVQMNVDQSYPFAQETNFLYLTGVQEPGWLLVIEQLENAQRVFLVYPSISETKHIFDGAITLDEVKKISGIDSLYSFKDGWQELKKLSEIYAEVHTIGKHPHEKYFEFAINPAQARLTKKLKQIFSKVIDDDRLIISKARAIKTPQEIVQVQKAINVTIEGLNEVRKQLNTFSYEYEVEALLNAAFRRKGTEGHAYEPIIAAGKNACTLHYNANNAKLPKSGLLLMDVGAKSQGYAADITRTFAIGVPTEREVAVHAAVEDAHKKIIALLKPGLGIKTYHEKVDEIMKSALNSLGLLHEPNDYRKYFPHAISHGLGLDVHESLGGYEAFQVGMLLTVEPGIYIPEEGIGVRIEDDILITELGNKNLSAALMTAL